MPCLLPLHLGHVDIDYLAVEVLWRWQRWRPGAHKRRMANRHFLNGLVVHDVAIARLNLKTFIVIIRVHFEVLFVHYVFELFNDFLCRLNAERMPICIETIIFNYFVELAVSQDNVDVQVAHLRHFDCLADERARPLALQVDPLRLVLDHILSLDLLFAVFLHCPFALCVG